MSFSYGDAQPPSRGAVRPLVGSQTSGGTNNNNSYGEPPSLIDMREPQKSCSSVNRNQVSEPRRERKSCSRTSKPRRFVWTPHLEKRFVDAVAHLGGIYYADPQRIMQVMNVEGLTLEEVVNHLNDMYE